MQPRSSSRKLIVTYERQRLDLARGMWWLGALVVLPAASTSVKGWDCELDPGLPPNLLAVAHLQPLCAGFINASAPP